MVLRTRFAAIFVAAGVLIGCQANDTAPEPDSNAEAPPSTDIWLYDISQNEVTLKARVTDWEGYDNQPIFTSGSNQLLFTSDRSGHADTHVYDVPTETIKQFSFTEADKYSPTPIPGTQDSQFSVVHTDSVAFQGLWRYTTDGTADPSPLVDVNAVAYYTWVGTDEILFWRLGTPNTLQLIDIATADTTVLAEGTVLSLHPISGQRASAYLFSQGDEPAYIMRFDWETQESTRMASALEGGRYFALTPSGDILMMAGGLLMSFTPGQSTEWARRADLGLTAGTRLAVSPNGMLLAVVGEAN